MWWALGVSIGGLAALAGLVVVIARLSRAKGEAAALQKQTESADKARQVRDDVEINTYGLPAADLERLRDKWSR